MHVDQEFVQFLEDVRKIVKWAVETIKQFFEAIKSTKIQHSKWHRMNRPIIRPLLLDKRSKIHRCRNAI